MKITAIPQLYRNLMRWQEILAVLQRYGLADWLSHFPQVPFRDLLKDREGLPLASQPREVRIRKALCELGPTFIKLGQMLASRSDLIGVALSEELKHLHANVPPDPPESVRRILREELGDNYLDYFRELSDEPIAAASIGQVHTATLQDGTAVVLKIQRDNIQATVQQDLEVLAGLAQLAQRVPALAAWGPTEIVSQLGPMLLRELDFGREFQNLRQFAGYFKDDESVAIPVPVEHLCTRRVLTMSRFCGQSVGDWIRAHPRPNRLDRSSSHLPPAEHPFADEASQDNESEPTSETAPDSGAHDTQLSTKQLGETITRCYMRMIFECGAFHADPHPGNLMLMDGQRLGILDFGMVGRIDDRLRESIEQILVAIANADHHSLLRLMKRVGRTPPTLDDASFSIDVAEYIGTYGQQELDRFDVTAALNDLSAILHRHSIKLPHQSALLLKMLISLEGTLREIGADFDSLTVIRSFVRRAMWRRLHPKRRLQQARRVYLEAEHFLEVAPDQVLDLLEIAKTGNLHIQLEHQKIGSTVNRLVLGLIASALFLGSALLLSQQVPPLLFPETTVLGMHRISIFGLAGCALSLLEMIRLMRAIRHSGALTRDDESNA